MRRTLVGRLLLAFCAGWPLLAAAEPASVMRLASLEWIPYVGAQLHQEGWSGSVVHAGAQQAGYLGRIDYFPWNRAMQLGMKDAAYAGYFPAYYTEERARKCHFSAPIGTSTIGLAYLKGTPLEWNKLSDLNALKIGVVAGFSNGPEFDALADTGQLNVDASPNDMLNLRKLLAHRVDAVVIDALVMRYLAATEPGIAAKREQLAFHAKPLAALSLHVCFQRTEQGRKMQLAFDAALRTLPLRKMEEQYFQRLQQKNPSASP